jgi:hypothetical protein
MHFDEICYGHNMFHLRALKDYLHLVSSAGENRRNTKWFDLRSLAVCVYFVSIPVTAP